MSLPDSTRDGVEDALRRLGAGSRIRTTTPIGGGCINNGVRIETNEASSFFLKWNADAPAGMFEAEADGLDALRATTTLRVPEALACGGGGGEPSWLLMEYIASGRGKPHSATRLGIGLAALHTASLESGTFGWRTNNWIGSLPQDNTESESWADFWCERRIVPQLRLARRAGYLTDGLFDRLLELIPAAVGDVAGPNLVHGDLWSGNAFFTGEGDAVVVDPAVYRGHGEVDLAMTELFGGFEAAFYDAYGAEHGISAAYRAYRKELYQLYYLLVHVNLFGASYAPGSRRVAERVVAELT